MILTTGHQTRFHSRSEQLYCHLLLAVYFRNCYKTGVAARTLSGLRSRQNLLPRTELPHPGDAPSSGPNYASFWLPMQEESLEFNVAQNTWAGLWKITLGEALQRFEGPRLSAREPSRPGAAARGWRRAARSGRRADDLAQPGPPGIVILTLRSPLSRMPFQSETLVS